ncbi:MAG: molybdopterin dinucleotide binding domain-containing protein, partial [Desulfotignum sp.]
PSPPEGQFRLTVGRCALHTHVATQNNPYLNELMSENVLWINTERAAAKGIKTGDSVEVVSKKGSGRIKAYVTDLIHPEAVFMLHGFGHESRMANRSYNKGLADGLLQENVTDRVGGSPALHHTFVSINPGN